MIDTGPGFGPDNDLFLREDSRPWPQHKLTFSNSNLISLCPYFSITFPISPALVPDKVARCPLPRLSSSPGRPAPLCFLSVVVSCLGPGSRLRARSLLQGQGGQPGSPQSSLSISPLVMWAQPRPAYNLHTGLILPAPFTTPKFILRPPWHQFTLHPLTSLTLCLCVTLCTAAAAVASSSYKMETVKSDSTSSSVSTPHNDPGPSLSSEPSQISQKSSSAAPGRRKQAKPQKKSGKKGTFSWINVFWFCVEIKFSLVCCHVG